MPLRLEPFPRRAAEGTKRATKEDNCFRRDAFKKPNKLEKCPNQHTLIYGQVTNEVLGS